MSIAKSKLYSTCLIVLFLLFGIVPVFAGNIAYPWRAASAFVKAGNSFEIFYQNIRCCEIDSVVLVGPFNRAILRVDSVGIGRFEYDTYTHLDVNNKISVHVPQSAPEELYDLVVYSGGEKHISCKSVKVLKQFHSPHSFIHISDLHISRQWEGTAKDGYAKELELFDAFVNVANIIAPDFVIITGDVIHHYTRFNADSTGWGGDKVYDANIRPLAEDKYKNYFDGAQGFSGIHALNAPTFSVTGNHDFYGVQRGDYYALSSQWNTLCGKRVYGFSYGGTRVVVSDDFLGDPVTDRPDSLPMSGLQGKVLEKFLQENGPGSMRIMAHHSPDRADTLFLNKHKVNILLNGHIHNPYYEYVGATPTLKIRSGTVCRSGDVLNWQETLGFFRIFYINKDKFEFTPALRFCENPTVDYKQLKINLTLDFAKPNDGSGENNKATLCNFFPVDLPQCKIRFVMKKGEYNVKGGTIQQVIQTDRLSVVDIRTDVNSNETKVVTISAK